VKAETQPEEHLAHLREVGVPEVRKLDETSRRQVGGRHGEVVVERVVLNFRSQSPREGDEDAHAHDREGCQI
jgi:hypothetical protein